MCEGKKKPLKWSTWEIIANNIREEYDDQNEYEVAEALHGTGKGNQHRGRAFALGAEGPVDPSNQSGSSTSGPQYSPQTMSELNDMIQKAIVNAVGERTPKPGKGDGKGGKGGGKGGKRGVRSKFRKRRTAPQKRWSRSKLMSRSKCARCGQLDIGHETAPILLTNAGASACKDTTL